MKQHLAFHQVQDLSQITKPLAGGLTYIYFVPIEDVLYISDINPATGTIGKVTLAAGKSYYRAFCAISNRSLVENPEDGEGGAYFAIQVNGFLPFQSLDNTLTLSSMHHHQYLVLVYTADGMIRLIGSKERGADFRLNNNSGQTYTDVPGKTISFYWQHSSTAPVFAPSLGELPDGSGGGGAPA